RGSARSRTIVFRQHAVHHVLVDVDTECLRNDVCDPWTAETRIVCFEFDDSLDQRFARPFRSGLLGVRPRRKQPAVLATHQGLMKPEKRRGAEGDGDLSDACCTEEHRPESTQQSVVATENSIGRFRRVSLSNGRYTRRWEEQTDAPPGATG